VLRVNPPRDAPHRRSQRLRLPAEFERCFTLGERLHGRCFRLHFLPAPAARLGLAVSRKVDPHAVGRNRIKRVAREAFRLARRGLPCGDCVLVAKREAAAATPAELRADLEQLWQRMRALKPTAAAGTMRDAPAPPLAPRGT
jgi:ribonuclease P protein component